MVGEVLFSLLNMTFCLEFHNALSIHLSPHDFGVVIKGCCETMVHGILATLDVHLDWWCSK